MNIEAIRKLQEQSGLTVLQDWIDSGMVWQKDGHFGRIAWSALESGACLLPPEPFLDCAGNIVPGINEVEPGATGSLENSARFWFGPAERGKIPSLSKEGQSREMISLDAITDPSPFRACFPTHQDIHFDMLDGGDEAVRLYHGDTYVDSSYLTQYLRLIHFHVSRRPILKSREADAIITAMITWVLDLVDLARIDYNHLTEGKQ